MSLPYGITPLELLDILGPSWEAMSPKERECYPRDSAIIAEIAPALPPAPFVARTHRGRLMADRLKP